MAFVDLHCHTIKIKDSEKESRNCSLSLFQKKTSEAQVSIIGITNHNFFDLEQYRQFSSIANGPLVFPGVEFDVFLISGGVGHCLLIVNPDDAELLKKLIDDEGCSTKETAKNHVLTEENLAILSNKMDSFLIVHYGSKDKAFSDTDIDFLKEHLTTSTVFVEPTNLISAFIYLSENKLSLVGSDCVDWSTYPGKKLPELKTEISSFKSLSLLFKKDPKIINSILDNRKRSELVQIQDKEFPDLRLSIPIFNDINIIFGGKSTGKSIILNDINDYFIAKGFGSEISFYKNDNKSLSFDSVTSFNPSTQDSDEFLNADCSNDFVFFKDYNNIKMPEIFKELAEFENSKSNKLKERLGFVDCSTNFSANYDIYTQGYSELKKRWDELVVVDPDKYKAFTTKDNIFTWKNIRKSVKEGMTNKVEDDFSEFYANVYANKAINSIKKLYSALKGVPTKPNDCGLYSLFSNSQSVFIHTRNILTKLSTDLKIRDIKVGELDKKGEIFRREIFGLNPLLMDKKFSFNNKNNITKLKDLLMKIQQVENSCYTEKCEMKISELSSAISSENVSDISYFFAHKSLLVKTNGEEVKPSSGEKSVLLLGSKLFENKEIYIFDEPEMSVGHDYVNRIIIPRLKELSKIGKTVIISTHDANIAVRTLPYLSLYREEVSDDKYLTFIGNPFIGKLDDVNGKLPSISWKEKTMEVLEGGEEAFNEREIAYE